MVRKYLCSAGVLLSFTITGLLLGRASVQIPQVLNGTTTSAITPHSLEPRKIVRATVVRWDKYGSDEPWMICIELPDGNITLAFSYDKVTPVVGPDWTVQVASSPDSKWAPWEVANGTWHRPGFKEPQENKPQNNSTPEKNPEPKQPM